MEERCILCDKSQICLQETFITNTLKSHHQRRVVITSNGLKVDLSRRLIGFTHHTSFITWKTSIVRLFYYCIEHFPFKCKVHNVIFLCLSGHR